MAGLATARRPSDPSARQSMDVDLNTQSLHLLKTLESSMHDLEQEAAHSVERARGEYEEYLDGRTKTLLGFELPPRIRRLLLHSSGSHFGMDDVNMSPLSSADSDHLLEVLEMRLLPRCRAMSLQWSTLRTSLEEGLSREGAGSAAAAAAVACASYAFRFVCANDEVLVARLRGLQDPGLLVRLHGCRWAYLSARQSVRVQLGTGRAHLARAQARIQKLRETEGTLQQLVESHMRIVSQINSHLLSTLWQTHDAVERQDLRSHLTASCDELESETVDAAWRWIRRSARLQYAVDGARAALDFSAADDRTDDLFRLKLATLTREVRALVTRRQFGQEAKAQPARRVNVPGRLVVQGCVGMLRLAPAWMHQVAQVADRCDRELREVLLALERVHSTHATVSHCTFQLFMHGEAIDYHATAARLLVRKMVAEVNVARERRATLGEAIAKLLAQPSIQLRLAGLKEWHSSAFCTVLQHDASGMVLPQFPLSDDEEFLAASSDDDSEDIWDELVDFDEDPVALAQELVARPVRSAAALVAAVPSKTAAAALTRVSRQRCVALLSATPAPCAAEVLQRMPQGTVYHVLEKASSSTRAALVSHLPQDAIIDLGSEILSEDAVREVVSAASPALLARMLEHTPPGDSVRFLFQPLLDAADARGVRWADARIQLAGSVTQLGSGLDTRSVNIGPGHQPLFDVSNMLDHPHAVALRRTHVSTLAAMSKILPACDAALQAFVLGPSRFAQVLVETTTEHGTAMLLVLPVRHVRAIMQAMCDEMLVAQLQNVFLADHRLAADMLSALPLTTVVRIAPALCAAQRLNPLLQEVPPILTRGLLVELPAHLTGSVLPELPMGLAVEVVSLLDPCTFAKVLPAVLPQFLAAIVKAADPQQLQAMATNWHGVWHSPLGIARVATSSLVALGRVDEDAAGRLLLLLELPLTRDVLAGLTVPTVATMLACMPPQYLANLLATQATSHIRETINGVRESWRRAAFGRSTAMGSDAMRLAVVDAEVAAATLDATTTADANAVWIGLLADALRPNPQTMLMALEEAEFDGAKLVQLLQLIGVAVTTQLWESLSLQRAVFVLRATITLAVPWWAEVLSKVQDSTMLGVLTGLEPFQTCRIIDIWPDHLVAHVMHILPAEMAAAVYEGLEPESRALLLLREHYVSKPSSIVRVLGLRPTLAASLFMHSPPADRVEMLSAMATAEAVAVLSCMTPDAAVTLCRQLPTDRLEPLAALMSVHHLVMLLDQMDRCTVTAVLSSLESAKANSVLRFMEGTVATELTLLMASEGTHTPESSSRLATNALNLLGSDALIEYLSRTQPMFASQLVLDLADVRFFVATMETLSPAILGPILAGCGVINAQLIGQWLAAIPATAVASALLYIEAEAVQARILEALSTEFAATIVIAIPSLAAQGWVAAAVLNAMLPVDAGRVLGCIAKQERQALGPLLNTNVRAHATSALLLKTMQANGPHRATFIKLQRGFLLWSKLLPLRKKLQVLLEQNMDVALIGLRGLAEPSSGEVAALCALVSLTAFPLLSSAVLEATQVPLSQLVEHAMPSDDRIISAIWTATVNHVLLRPPSRSTGPHAQPASTTIEKMQVLVDLAQSGSFGDAERRGEQVASTIMQREFPRRARATGPQASPHCIAVVRWVRTLLEMHRMRCAPREGCVDG